MLDDCYAKDMQFDIVFIDADKKTYLEYLKRVINEDGVQGKPLIKEGGLIIADNTLWKNLVLAQVRVHGLSRSM
jgi:caffeoyl-CoA O-methyltransferase